MSPKPLYRGDIVLVPFPFTDLSSSKVRPTIIVSADNAYPDIVLAFISSAAPSPLTATDRLIETTDPAFPRTGLKKSSLFRMRKMASIERKLIHRRLGCVGPRLMKELDAKLRIALGL